MATAKIIFQQNGDGYATPCSRDDLVLSLPVTMLNQDNTGVSSWTWTMVDKPTGSSASIVSPTASSTTFTPDIIGTYLIHLSVNAGAAQDQRGAAVKTINYQYRIPAATETIEFDGYRGWATATNKALKSIDDGYIPLVLPTLQSVYNASNPSSFTINATNGGLQIHDASTPTGSNLFEVDAYGAGSKFFTITTAATSVNNNLLITGTNLVGVNTPTPLYPVHVTTATDNYSFIQTRSTISGGLYAQTAGTAGLGLGTVSNNALFFFTNNTPGTPSIVLATSGSVGIGNPTPTSKLDVTGTGHFTGNVILDSALNVTGLGTFNAHISVDGYTFNINGGATTGQTVIYNGTQFVPSNIFQSHALGAIVSWISGSSAGTYTAGTGAGLSGATITVTGCDEGGIITVVTGITPSTSSAIITINFLTAFANPPAITLTAGNDLTGQYNQNSYIYVTSTTSSFTIFSSGTASLSNPGTYIWHWNAKGFK